MKKLMVLLFIFLYLPLSIFADKPKGSEYIDGGESKVALILAHGKDKYPTWLVVDPVRKGVNSSLGYHTLSLQMPTGYSDWKEYAKSFPEAFDSIKKGIDFLRNEKGVEKIFLFGHSMGSRMISSFVSENFDENIAGLIVAGCRNNGGTPLSCKQNLKNIDIPVLDIWGGKNNKDSKAASKRKSMVSSTYKQVPIQGANHKFETKEDALVEAVVSWLKEQN